MGTTERKKDMGQLINTIACVAVIAAASPAQKMGHSNSKAPEVTQTIKLDEKATVKIHYTSITWASGSWERALQDPQTRDKMRERINSTAAENPLGRFETDVDLMVGGQHIHKGSYKMAFTLTDEFAWQLTLRSDHSMSVPLLLSARAKPSKRLVLNLNAGDEDATAVLVIGFGARECQLDIQPHLKQSSSKSAKSIINSKCPLMDDPADPEVTVTYKAKVIGLCCEDCIDDWAKLSTGEKDQHLAKMLAGKK